MAPPPRFKRFPMEQLEEESEGVRALAAALSDFAQDTVNALTRALTRAENTTGGEWEGTFTTGDPIAADAAPFPLYFRPPAGLRPRSVWVVDIENLTNGAAAGVPTSAVQPVWRLTSDGQVAVRMLTGLSVSTKYRVRFLME